MSARDTSGQNDWASVRAEIQADQQHIRQVEIQGILAAGTAILFGVEKDEPFAFAIAGLVLVLAAMHILGTAGIMHMRAEYVRTQIEVHHGGGWEAWWSSATARRNRLAVSTYAAAAWLGFAACGVLWCAKLWISSTERAAARSTVEHPSDP